VSGDFTAEDFRVATGVSRETLDRLQAYADLLERWALRVNLVSRASLADLWRRHMLDSAQLRPLLPSTCRRLVDLGSGAGFPGLVLAILGVTGVELVEATARKCAFLREVARLTDTVVTIRQARVETLDANPADVITARGFAPVSRLFPLAFPLVNDNTLFLLPKGACVDEELTTARETWTMTLRRIPSASDPSGVVLHIQGLKRVEPS